MIDKSKIDEFVTRVTQMPLTSDTEVSLVYHCVTEIGVPVSFPVSVTPLISAKGLPHDVLSGVVEQAYRQTIIQNIVSLLGSVPDGFMMIKDAPVQVPLKLMDVKLKVA
jgi:hypothetical protein